MELQKRERSRPVDEMFRRYGEFHRNATNEAIHWICVPLIAWSVVGMLWAASPILEATAMAASLAFYAWLSPRLALGMAAAIAVMVYAASLIGGPLFEVSVAIFILAWIGQFVGHRIEGRKPAFIEDVRALLIGPAWVLAFVYRRLGIAY
jgi:uncharacterized membrane protein YGL010W